MDSTGTKNNGYDLLENYILKCISGLKRWQNTVWTIHILYISNMIENDRNDDVKDTHQ